MPVELGERSQQLLRTLIDSYVKDGQPVGSKVLARDSGLDLSPATIRNVMAELERLGLIVSPHTSAGRVPTAKGYRLFVDTLVNVQPLQKKELQRLAGQFGARGDESTEALIGRASDALSELTKLAGVVMVPNPKMASLRHIEFISLSENQVLAVLVVNNSDVRNVIIPTDRGYSRSELEQVANYLNHSFAGEGFAVVRHRLMQEMTAAREGVDSLMRMAIDMADKVFLTSVSESTSDFVVAGQTNLMNIQEMSQMEKLRQLFDAFNEKRDILYLLDGCMQDNAMKVFIGEESGYQALDECSVVTAPYEVDGECVGVLGVIGPTRMAYEKVIPVVDATAKLLGNALNRR